MKKKIIFQTDFDQNLENHILLILSGTDYDNFTLNNIALALGKKYKEGSKDWNKLKLHLMDMERKGLIEERHFGKEAGNWEGIVDYVLKNKGIKRVGQVTT